MAGNLGIVTGAYGFLGRHTARYLARQGWHVIGIGHGSWPEMEWRAWGLKEWHACDVTLETLLLHCGTPDLIFHCAGGGSVGFSITHPARDTGQTVETTLDVLEYVRLHAPRAAVVYPSSAAVYGVTGQMPIKTETPPKPVSPYGVHKGMAEQLCQSYGRHFGISGLILRYFSLYGPGLRKQLFWDACNKIKRNDIAFPGTGNETRDWLYVGDAATLCERATEHASVEWPIANGGSGTATSIREVLTELFKQMRCSDSPRFTGANRAGDPTNYQADISLAQSWGWTPAVNWRAGVREYVAWFGKETA